MKRFILCLIAILLITGCAPQVSEETTVADETQPSPPAMIEIDGSYTGRYLKKWLNKSTKDEK